MLKNKELTTTISFSREGENKLSNIDKEVKYYTPTPNRFGPTHPNNLQFVMITSCMVLVRISITVAFLVNSLVS